jgi:D-alanine-D-alanine ligase
MPSSSTRVVVLHNTDYDAELTAGTGTDVSAVLASAHAVRDGLLAAGIQAETMGVHGLDVFDVLTALKAKQPDVVFNLCESMAGDSRHEPTMCGLLELFGFTYTGSPALALGACLHKDRTKDILRGRGVATPPHRLLESAADLTDEALAGLDYPWFLKLVHEDASVGIEADCLVRNADELRRRATYMFGEWKQPVLAERYVDGREFNVTVLGEAPHLEILPLHEIDFADMPPERPRIVSYAAKWDEAHVDYAGTKPVPARNLSDADRTRIERIAKDAFTALGLRDYGRVDLRCAADGTPYVIDVNPNCDISPDAGVARAAAVAGMSYPQLMAHIVASALRRRRAA